MKQVQYVIIRSVGYSAQRRRISHEVWLVIALDTQLHPEYLSHGPFREIPVFWICVRGGTLLWGKLCPVTLVCLLFTIKRGAVYGICGPGDFVFSTRGPFGKALLEDLARISGWSNAGGGGRSRTKFVHPAHQCVQGWKTRDAWESKENQGIRPVLTNFLLLCLS